MHTPGRRARIYALLVAAYRRWRLYVAPERLRMRKVCAEWLTRLPSAATIVEIGGGSAFLKSTIERVLPQSNYISGDIAPRDVTKIVFDATALPIANAAVDGVLALEVLEHIERPELMIGEIARVLKPGGWAILTMPFMYGVHDFRDYQRYTPLGFQTLLEPHGLDLTEVRQRGGTFVAANGLVRTLVQKAIIGAPAEWRVQGPSRKVRWVVATVVGTPWSLLTWTAVGLDYLVDRDSDSPPGYFFLIRRR